MSAELLRQAATILRERANKATPGPWRVTAEGSEGSRIAPDCSDKRERSRFIGIMNGRIQPEDGWNATYSATMHPAVGLALADWLDTAGADLWAHGPLCECGSGCFDCDDSLWQPHVRRALTVAEATDRVEVRTSDAKSGARFERMVIDGQRCFLKVLSAEGDWIMRVTGNTSSWEMKVWQAGLYARTPGVIDHTVRAANGRVPVIAGCGSYSTEAAIEMGDTAADVTAALASTESFHARNALRSRARTSGRSAARFRDSVGSASRS